MNSEKIYIEQIDGTTSYFKVDALKIDVDKYQIEFDNEFEKLDSDCLFEFFPSDIVKVKEHRFSDGTTGKVAKELIKPGDWNNRKLNEFMFKATTEKLELNKLTLEKYSNEIKKIWEEKNDRFFYPKLIEIIKMLKEIE